MRILRMMCDYVVGVQPCDGKIFMVPRIVICILLSLIGSVPAIAQSDDDDFPPGLHAKYTSNGKTITRVDTSLAFNWEQSSPDQRLPKGNYQAEWTGQIIVKKSAPYAFHGFANGDFAVELDGKKLLSGKTKSAAWVSGKPVELRAGIRKLRVTYRKTNPSARFQLFWSAERFSIEPLPPQLLFRSEPHAQLKQIETGRVLVDAHRCNRCHVRANDRPSSPGPDLTHVVTNLSAVELTAKIQNPRHNAPHAKMPAFGFTKEESYDVAAFLRSVSKSVKLNPLPKPRRNRKTKKQLSDGRLGEVLIRSVGCLACHTAGRPVGQAFQPDSNSPKGSNVARVRLESLTYGNDEPYSGGDLLTVGKKRSAEWLYQWLLEPQKLNADHRMPVFKLTNEERRVIAVFLSKKRDNKSSNTKQSRGVSPRATITHGRKLVEQARCAACHTIPGIKFKPTKLTDLSRGTFNGKNSCLQKRVPKATKYRPHYSNINVTAINTFLLSHAGKLAPLSPFEAGRRVLARRNCTACHPQGLQQGIVSTAGAMSKLDPELRGQSQGLIPPSLNAVGDKLLDVYLKTAIAGEQKSVRLPWLRVRMPKFVHSKTDADSLTTHLIGHDRIPENAPTVNKLTKKLPTASQTLIAGQTLLGIRGFSCIACHTVGEYEPRNVALGTRGSDLMQMAGRIRKPFFDRWTRSAIRIVPGMEMPSYHGKPVPGVLNDDVDLQLAVLWNALNDKRFKPPTNPSVVEQFLTVKPGAPARIVRDVFTVPKENGGGYIARSLAIGLDNGHNLLFDLDTYSLRGWYFGDFARQRTQGKSWYWDMAGVPVMTGLTPGPDFILVKKDKKTGKETVYLPKRVNGVFARPVAMGSGSFVQIIVVKITFNINGADRSFLVKDQIMGSLNPIRLGSVAPKPLHRIQGWYRTITLYDRLKSQTTADLGDLTLHIARPIPVRTIGQPKISVLDEDGTQKIMWRRFREIPNREYCRAKASTIVLSYSAKLTLPRLSETLKPKEIPLKAEFVNSVPGFHGVRLPVSRGIMPTALTWTQKGRLAFTSLKGHVFITGDSNHDGVEDRLSRFAEGLAAPYGLVSSEMGFVIAHKPELLVADSEFAFGENAKAGVFLIRGDGWGYNDNYHDWTCGIVRDKKGNLYVGLGSDYAQKNRPKEQSRWRGKVLQISPKGKVTPFGHSFRYPTGLAMNHTGDIFVSDNQGVQNTFNEINHLQQGKHYGVPSRHEKNRNAPVTPPAIQVPHPWTRSVNGIFFLPKRPARRAGSVNPPVTSKNRNANNTGKTGGFTPAARHFVKEFAGHGIGCEYDNRFLIRFSLQKVDGEYQGACYAFSKPTPGRTKTNFLGPLCGGVAPDGAIYIGSIYDSGWLGGRNTGDIVRLVPNGKLPNGIRELRVTKDGFEIEFIRSINKTAAMKPGSYSISGYTRVWKGGYATPDSNRHTLTVKAVSISPDNKTVRLTVPNRHAGRYVYDVTVGKIGTKDQPELWPTTGYYTLHHIPK